MKRRGYTIIHDADMPTLMQATPYVHLVMNCQNPDCKRPIRLPAPKTQDESFSQSEWPTKGWTRYFLCAECGQGYEYSSRYVLRENQDAPDPWTAGKCQCFSVQYGCDVGNCGTRIIAYVVADAGLNSVQLTEKLSKTGSTPRVCFPCSNRDMYFHFASMPEVLTPVAVKLSPFPY
jgi:hypothetical protein